MSARSEILIFAATLVIAACGHAFARAGEDAGAQHVAPPPPEHPMPAMSAEEMTRVMGMDDAAPVAMFKLDRLERTVLDGDRGEAWKGEAWFGDDFDRLLIRSEGEHAQNSSADGDIEVLWDRAASAFWNTELGARVDFGRGTHRNWLAIGTHGLVPYGFDVEATAYLGASGRTALRVEAAYEILLMQRLILRPRIEANIYGRSDREAGIGAGLDDATAGVRLRYEIRREIAPYIGVEWTRRFGRGADFARLDGSDVRDRRFVAGIRLWY